MFCMCPNLSCNLLSISKSTCFHLSVSFRNWLHGGWLICSDKKNGGLYFFENGIESSSTYFEFVYVFNDNEIMLWHFKLGHPNFSVFKTLYFLICLRIKYHLHFNMKFVHWQNIIIFFLPRGLIKLLRHFH